MSSKRSDRPGSPGKKVAARQEPPSAIIAQRVASVQDADLILVMDNGHIADMGTHDQLLASSEIYREVYESQTNGGEQDEA